MSAIDAQNAKQIRDAMDVVIQLDATATSYGDVITITNENLIRATVSLRSDLSIIEPTLPESEINVEAYWPEDVAEAVAAIPDDTPITYSAGYPGDMSPERKFYVSGQVTWADNVLTIHGVDAVHFLDVEAGPCLFWAANPADQLTAPYHLLSTCAALAQKQGVALNHRFVSENIPGFSGAGQFPTTVIPRGTTLRELLAFASNVFKLDNLSVNYFSGTGTLPDNYKSFWVGYTDAGRPVLNSVKPEPIHTINESDCADVKKEIEPRIREIQVDYTSAVIIKDAQPVSKSQLEFGTVEWSTDYTGFINVDSEALLCMIAFGVLAKDVPTVQAQAPAIPILPASADGYPVAYNIDCVGANYQYWRYSKATQEWRQYTGSFKPTPLIDSNTMQELTQNSSIIYTQVIPPGARYASDNYWIWTSQSAAWAGLKQAGYIGSDDNAAELKVLGKNINRESIKKTYIRSGEGGVAEIRCLLWGEMQFWDSARQTNAPAYPDPAFQSLLNRSNVTGSFRWKGDPRQQPRDVATFILRDGTEETITLENITIQHEKGGTYADYTYRKGIV